MCVLIASLAALQGCGAPAKPYVIGVVLGTEGEYGAKLALDRLNAAGGVQGRRLDLHILRGKSNADAQMALAAAESLAGDARVLAVIGHSNSAASLSASQVYNHRRIVQIAPTTTAPLYGEAGPYSFRMVPSDEHQARFLATEVQRRKRARVAVVYVNDDYGRSLHTILKSALVEMGIPPAFDAAYVEGDADTGAPGLVSGLRRTKPTTLVWLGRAHEFARVAKQLRSVLPDLEVLASDGFGGALVDTDTSGLLAGVRYVRLVNLATTDTAFTSVRAEYRKFGLGDISDQAALGFDAVMVVGAAIQHVGGDRERIRTWLAELGRDRPAYGGITGPVAFPRPGNPSSHYYLVPAAVERRASTDR